MIVKFFVEFIVFFSGFVFYEFDCFTGKQNKAKKYITQ